MLYLIAFLTALVAYLIGSISGAIIISKKVSGSDIRESGSKNAGTTNMLRVHGKKLAVMTLLVDVIKGIIAVLIGIMIDAVIERQYGMVSIVSPAEWLIGSMKYIAAIFAILGHDFPIYFGFKGGKGVATSIGVALVLDWKVRLIVMIASLIIMATTRYVSVGSVIAAVIYPCIVAAFMLGMNEFNVVYLACAIIIGLLIIVKHKTNIERLKNGTENKLFTKKEQ
jgi:glycerol-3-phosphate acyltransferase PlsY